MTTHIGPCMANKDNDGGDQEGKITTVSVEELGLVSEGDAFVNGAFFIPSGDPNASKKFGGNKMLPYQPGEKAPFLTKFAGSLDCTPGKPC
ncbi:hypothetical protein F3Y22_tig00111221pilonHSYRG00029 [Hibiscus syriacus]|uniref:Uncharacterized protein n=1 Tax=Hibiscus syriacus TaxID=106335 RepID=A0A6A2YUB9_HIBSY|nr:hypothetical protein F3Y22_tig00111221pilonHSYRG00029 [Hibiscus syriacus]